jgi:predicted amidohydrolase YtcJ
MTGTLITNTLIYTLDNEPLGGTQPTAAAIAIEEGRILAVGATDGLLAEFGSRFAIEDLHGLVLLPGLTDSHLHLQYYALELDMVDCETSTKAECLQRVAERARSTPPGEWIRGHNYNQNAWPDGAPDAADLDAAAPHNPVYVVHKSHHSAWVNHPCSQAGRTIPATPTRGGRRSGVDGSLDGILYEENAMELVERVIPGPQWDSLLRHSQALPPSVAGRPDRRHD